MKPDTASEPSVLAERAKSRARKAAPSKPAEVASWPAAEERLSRRCRKMIQHFEKAFSFGAHDGLVEDASRSLAALESAILAAPALTIEALRFKLQLIRRTPSAWRSPEETDDLLAILANDLERPEAPAGSISQSAQRGR